MIVEVKCALVGRGIIREGISRRVWGLGQGRKGRNGVSLEMRKFVTKDNSTVWNIIFHFDDFTVIEFGD